MSDIFREVDEEIRQEQIITFVKRYGKYVLAAVVVAIIVFATVRYFEDQQRQEREAAGDRFAVALSLLVDDKVAEAVSAFAVLAEENGSDGYGLLARFRRAEALYQSEEVQSAVAVYDAIAADGSVEDIWRNLAGLYGAMLALQTAGSEEMAERLDSLSDSDSAWHLSVLELRGLNQIKDGDQDGARVTFRQLYEEAPEAAGFRGRAAQMLSILGVSVSELTDE